MIRNNNNEQWEMPAVTSVVFLRDIYPLIASLLFLSGVRSTRGAFCQIRAGS
jgi:hypothetical protein